MVKYNCYLEYRQVEEAFNHVNQFFKLIHKKIASSRVTYFKTARSRATRFCAL